MEYIKYVIMLVISMNVTHSLSGQEAKIINGEMIPNIILNSPTGLEYGLYDLEGKMVLINFWASWCMECLDEASNMNSIYEEYKDKSFSNGKGLEIYNISLDIDKNSWIRMMNLYKMNWTYNVSDLKGWNSIAVGKYEIEDLPANILIDGEGTILGKNFYGEKLKEKLECMVNE